MRIEYDITHDCWHLGDVTITRELLDDMMDAERDVRSAASQRPIDLARTAEVRARIESALKAHEIWGYDDFPGAWSTHGIPYRVFAIAGGSYDDLINAAVDAISKGRTLGAKHLAWRGKPEICHVDGEWKLWMRFHLLPSRANDAFWGAVPPKPEGAAVHRLDAH